VAATAERLAELLAWRLDDRRFGTKALIQRCRRHKERNVAQHLLEAEQPLIQRPAEGRLGHPGR
jgi:hypothetical protein